MRRAVSALTIAALVLPVACGDDEEASPEQFTVAFLRAVSTGEPEPLVEELRSAGFVPGDNLVFIPSDLEEVHLDPADAERAVRGWIDDGVDLIFAFSSTGAAAAKKVTSEVPILFLVNDPTAVGLVEDEDRPEANLTGVTFRVPADRTLDLARQAVPGLAKIGVLFPSEDPAAAPHRDAVITAGDALGIEVVAEAFSDDADVSRALDALTAAGVDAVLIANAPTSIRALGVIEPAVTERGLPLIANTDLATSALVVFQPDTDELVAQLGRQAVRILQGADPSDLPVEDPRHFRVILNPPVAAQLGLPEFPLDLLRTADEVKQ